MAIEVVFLLSRPARERERSLRRHRPGPGVRFVGCPGIHERTLIIEARDLDTDERAVATFEVEMPTGEAAQRAQLAGLVARLHPHARMRSFGEGAASFLDSQRLVVAHYRAIDEQSPADEVR